ncbi:hypothetical protein [Symbioplanes lichenis]|uniref:hypothetical protein n=1 Tax=Symbioplanes lichenis TaxID=1629072 RepID=UPI002738BA0E|nr:hypothetical protein [Actinoplanes lichenis]
MFTPPDRDRLRAALLARAGADPAVTGAAWTGSQATGGGDRWSDTDLVLSVRDDVATVTDNWTQWLETEFGVRHHWDLAVGASVVRVFLLPGWLEVDLTFAPEAEFGARGHRWQTIFGQARTLDRWPDPEPAHLTGLLWHHALHAWVSLERGRWWQAEHWISAMRDHVITLACVRLGLPSAYAKGAHLLPPELNEPLAATLVRELSEAGLRRALDAALALVTDELTRSDPDAARRLGPMLAELSGRRNCP